ncbi:hypothetical protein FQR65_LT00855 [Abscondita terminalis]|nr:hypothetical protein FQR65_LT00855 [Abscondita terminalis]
MYGITLFLLWVLKENIVEIRKNVPNNWEVLKFLLWSPVLLVSFAVLLVLVPVAKLYQLIVTAILKIKLGNEYCESITGTNLLMGADIWHNSLINTLVVVQYNSTLTNKNFFDYTKKIFERRRSENRIHKKFFAGMYKFMGYLFFKNLKVELNDVLRPLPLADNLDKKELINVLKTCVFQPLPLDGAVLWDLYIGTQPIQNWKTNTDAGVEYYPLLFRTHHVLADGASLSKTLQSLFHDCDEIVKSDFEPMKTMTAAIIETAHYCKKCPDYITTALPVITDLAQLRKLRQIDSNNVTATNQYSLLQLKLPINVSKCKSWDSNAPMISRAKIVGEALETLKNSIEPQFSSILLEQLLGSLPFWFMQKFGQNIQNTAATTFLPGPPKLVYKKGVYEISDCVFWVPHILNLGVGFSSITYDDHLAIGLSSDSQFKDQFYVDEILNNIYRNIDLMEEEIERLLKKE